MHGTKHLFIHLNSTWCILLLYIYTCVYRRSVYKSNKFSMGSVVLLFFVSHFFVSFSISLLHYLAFRKLLYCCHLLNSYDMHCIPYALKCFDSMPFYAILYLFLCINNNFSGMSHIFSSIERKILLTKNHIFDFSIHMCRNSHTERISITDGLKYGFWYIERIKTCSAYNTVEYRNDIILLL